MLDSAFRSQYQSLLIRPILAHPLGRKLSPTTATLLGLCFGIAVLPLLAFHFSGLAIAALLISGYFDTLDGPLARHQKTTSSVGAVLDIVCDRLVEFCVILGLFMYDPQMRSLACMLMLGSVLICVTSFLVVGIFSENHSEKGFYYSVGLMERAEAFIVWTAMILWPSGFLILSWIFTLLVIWTAILRVFQFSKHFK